MGRTLQQMGLYTWDQLPDNYDFAQLAGNWNIVNFHDHSPGRGVPIPMGGIAQGAVGPLQLASGVPLIAGGHQITAAAETRTNTVYGVMPTPDQVSNIVMGASGIIRVWFYAQWQESVAGAGRASIFIGPTQLKVGVPGSVPVNTEAATSATSTVGVNAILASSNLGLGSSTTQGVATTGADATTGQVFGASVLPNTLVGGTAAANDWTPVNIFAAAGTYTVSVQFRATSGSVTVSNRNLYVQVNPL